MDIRLDRECWTQDPAAGTGGETRTPEWHGLRARLAAARAASHAMAGEQVAARGSFDGVSARVISDYGLAQGSVNSIFWANGKPRQRKGAVVAGETNSGARGY